MSNQARAHVLTEATYRQLLELKPNVAILPWGATEAHNYHLPYGTDNILGSALAETAAGRANSQGARCIVLPCVPVGINHAQLYQVATLTLRSSTQQLILRDIAESLSRQGIDRLVLLNFHGGNEFKAMIRDLMFDLPIFIVQVSGWLLAPEIKQLLERLAEGGMGHADEFETSLMLHLAPQWVAPLESAGDGALAPMKLRTLGSTPGVWAQRPWQELTKDTGAGDPRCASAEKGQCIFEMLVGALVPVLVELSAAKNGDLPYKV